MSKFRKKVYSKNKVRSFRFNTKKETEKSHFNEVIRAIIEEKRETHLNKVIIFKFFQSSIKEQLRNSNIPKLEERMKDN